MKQPKAKAPAPMPLADEITSVLDPRARTFVMGYLGEFVERGGCVLLATNIVSEVHHYASHLILLEAGRVRFNLPVEEVASRFLKLRRPRGADHAVFQDPEAKEVGINSDQSVAYLVPASKAGAPIEFTDPHPVTPEEMFIYLMRRGDRAI